LPESARSSAAGPDLPRREAGAPINIIENRPGTTETLVWNFVWNFAEFRQLSRFDAR
jgi:hypothetical protein